MALKILLPQPGFDALSSIPAPTYSIWASAIFAEETVLVVDMSSGLIMPLRRIYSVPSVILSFFWPLISRLPFGKTLTIVAERVPLKLFDWFVAIDPANELVFATAPPNPAKFLKIPVPPISAPILSAFADEFVTALLDEKVSLKVTDKMSPTFFALLSEEKSPEELVLYIEPLDGSALSNSSNDGFNGLNCWLLASST